MFSGIVRARGVVHSNQCGDGAALEIAVHDANFRAAVGDSVAVNGACLTVARLDEKSARLGFDVSAETLDKCLIGQWQTGYAVNLESALGFNAPVGGHLVGGHVDGVGVVTARQTCDNAFVRMTFETAQSLGKLIAPKGSIAVDGVGLTVNTVDDCAAHCVSAFAVMLVPHTLTNTTLSALQPGARVHLEVDLIARYVHRLAQFAAQNNSASE